MATDDIYIQNLEEFVNDENKIVTYKWLSRTLQVHVNTAKQMLYAFVEQQRNKKDNDSLSVAYAVAGVAADKHGNKYNKIQVVPEEQLEVAKSQLDPVTSCHVYSVQKSKLLDPNPLYNTDYSAFKEDIFSANKFSSISCASAKLRNLEEVESLRKTAMPEQREPAFKPNTSKPNNSKPIKSSSKQAGIAGMFSNAKPKSTAQDSDKSSETQKSQEKATSKPKPQKGVLAFFTNQAAKPKKDVKAEDKEQKPGKTSKETAPAPSQTSSKSSKESKDNKASKSRRKQEDSDDEDPLPEKKRRRIKHQSWESSSEEEEDMEEEPIPPSPPPREPSPPAKDPSPPRPDTPEDELKENNVKVNGNSEMEAKVNGSPKPTNKVKGKRRKRVQKTKTYMNDEGYFVTEKVWESEYSDCSDDVVEVKSDDPKVKVPSPSKSSSDDKSQGEEESKKKKAPAKKRGKAAATNSKQMSMTSFFKKKD